MPPGDIMRQEILFLCQNGVFFPEASEMYDMGSHSSSLFATEGKRGGVQLTAGCPFPIHSFLTCTLSTIIGRQENKYLLNLIIA